MLSSSRLKRSTAGEKMTGSHPSPSACQRRSLSITISIGRWQWAHSVSTRTDSAVPRRSPCTKGVANASTAQAA